MILLVDTGEELGAQLGVAEERVKHKLAENFDKPAFNSIVATFQKSSRGKVNVQTVRVLQKRLQLLHAPGYQTTGGNLDILITYNVST